MKDWAGRTAFVLAAFVAGGWATALVISATPWTDLISDTGANLLSTVGGVLAGAVATYLGHQAGTNETKTREPEHPPEDVGP